MESPSSLIAFEDPTDGCLAAIETPVPILDFLVQIEQIANSRFAQALTAEQAY